MMPYVGQVVLYYPQNSSCAVPAVVTTVWSEECVNLELMVGPRHPPRYFSVPVHETGCAGWAFTEPDAAIARATDGVLDSLSRNMDADQRENPPLDLTPVIHWDGNREGDPSGA